MRLRMTTCPVVRHSIVGAVRGCRATSSLSFSAGIAPPITGLVVVDGSYFVTICTSAVSGLRSASGAGFNYLLLLESIVTATRRGHLRYRVLRLLAQSQGMTGHPGNNPMLKLDARGDLTHGIRTHTLAC